MKTVITACLVLVAYFSAAAHASQEFECIYSKATLDNGVLGPMRGQDRAKVLLNQNDFIAYRPNGVYLSSPNLNTKQGTMRLGIDGGKVFVASDSNDSFSVADRIGRSSEQWANCSIKKESPTPNPDEIKGVENLSSAQAKEFFIKEKHAFTTNCLVWDDVTMITGQHPAMIIAGGIMMGSNPRWSGKEYSFSFNNGSMIARFTPSESKHKLLLQAGDKFYGCGPSTIDHSYD